MKTVTRKSYIVEVYRDKKWKHWANFTSKKSARHGIKFVGISEFKYRTVRLITTLSTEII